MKQIEEVKGYTPNDDRLLVLQEQAEEKTKSGIIIPDTAQEKPRFGHVVAVGPGKVDYAMQSNVGDRVQFGTYGGTEISWKGKDYLLIREPDLFAWVCEEDEEDFAE